MYPHPLVGRHEPRNHKSTKAILMNRIALAPGPHPPTLDHGPVHQQSNTSPGTSTTQHISKLIPAPRHFRCLNCPPLAFSPTHQQVNMNFGAPQLCQELDPPIIRQTLDTGSLVPQKPTTEHSSAHQWASLSPRIPQGSAASCLCPGPSHQQLAACT